MAVNEILVASSFVGSFPGFYRISPVDLSGGVGALVFQFEALAQKGARGRRARSPESRRKPSLWRC